MHIVVQQSELKQDISTVIRAVSGKGTLPVLSNILLEARFGTLQLVATDLQVAISRKSGIDLKREGRVTLPAKLFSDVINGLPSGDVSLELDERTATVRVKSGRFTSNIKGIDADEFPAITSADDCHHLATLDAAALANMIERVAIAAAKDDSRPVLAGVLLRHANGKAQLAAADGYRLAIGFIASNAEEDFSYIIPAPSLFEVARTMASGLVHVGRTVNGNQLVFSNETTQIATRLIDGKFPDFERIVPAKHETRTILEVAELARALKIAANFATSAQNVVKLTIEQVADEPGKIVVSANASEVGDNTGEVDAQVTGHGECVIALNVKYLSEALTGIKTAQVALETQTSQAPAVLRPVGGDEYVHIVMPMSIRS